MTACGRIGFTVCGAACGASPSTTEDTNVAFVTSTLQLPTTFGADLAGADQVCMQRAAAGNLPGKYVALVSTSTVSAATRLVGSRGWVRVDGVPVMDLPADLVTPGVLAPIDRDETGALVTGPVATATNQDGTPAMTHTCANSGDPDFSDATGTIEIGFADQALQGALDTFESQSCATAAPIYCFGVGKTAPLVIAPPANARKAFVTAEGFVVDATGLTKADALCASEAQAAGLSGTFTALLPTISATAISRFSDTERPWVRLDGVQLAASSLAFIAGELDAPLDETSLDMYVSENVLTGGIPPGQAASQAGNDCMDWTDPNNDPNNNGAAIGNANDVALAFSNGDSGQFCSGQDPIYCLEQ
jgi:hypothetical protein